jgi:hypothetical protein
MEARLTLKLDKKAIEAAKIYAKRHNRSISGIVENYFRNLSPENVYQKKHSPIVESLTGILSEDDLEKFVQEDERVRYILKREI